MGIREWSNYLLRKKMIIKKGPINKIMANDEWSHYQNEGQLWSSIMNYQNNGHRRMVQLIIKKKKL